MRRGLVVLSGGLDSTVCMAIAVEDTGSAPLALTFDYGQRTRRELARAAEIAAHFGSEHLVVGLDMRAWGGSALTDSAIEVPLAAGGPSGHDPAIEVPCAQAGPPAAGNRSSIPVTYVPARNIIFLSVAMGVAEARHLDAIYIGINALDYSGYPDCRPEFVEAFKQVAAVGQKRGVEGNPVDIRTPLISMTKAEIAAEGTRLGAPLSLTWSCYLDAEQPCGACESCILRAKGFAEAGLPDPGVAS